MVELLHNAGADIETTASVATLLPRVVLSKDFDLAQLLIDKGAFVGVQGTQKEPMLHISVATDDTEEVEFLLRNHSDVNAKDRRGGTPLIVAAGYGPVAAMGMLISKGASLDIQDTPGQTASHLAAASGSVEATSFLLENGAEPFIFSRDGSAAIGVARDTGHTAVEDMIQQSLIDSGRLIQDPR